MTQTVAYVRVSTEDQVEYSPDAQAKRCRDLAKLRDLGAVKVLADEGWSAKNLERPQMRELISMVEAGQVGHLIIWRWDRLSRDQGDSARLVKIFKAHHVKVHSVNEGDLDLESASGQMQIGVHGVFAQYYRDQIMENTRMGQRQAAEKGHWINRAPSGYDMINGALKPNDMAPLVQQVFTLRAQGASYGSIESQVGIKYSTVRHICLNRVYLGQVTYQDEWFDGRHAPLVDLALFNAAQRSHTPGQRRSKDLLSGRVRCGLCGRVAGVHYNDRNFAIYRCRHRGSGCNVPGRSAQGLQRAMVIGLREYRNDPDLTSAIRYQLTEHRRQETPLGPSATTAVAALRRKQEKLLNLHYADQIDGETFSVQNRHLMTQIVALEEEEKRRQKDLETREHAADRFDEVASLLATTDFEQILKVATEPERRVLVEDLIDSVCIYPDQITVQVAGAPPILVTLDEAGLTQGCKPVASEARREPARELIESKPFSRIKYEFNRTSNET